jgi:hypothetical protein
MLSILTSRGKVDTAEETLFHLPEDHGASLEQARDDESAPSVTNMRICYTCGQNKKISDFPLSLRKNHQCRVCFMMEGSGLDSTCLPCEGDSSLREITPILPSNPKAVSDKSGMIDRSPTPPSPPSNAEDESTAPQFVVSESAQFV